MDVRVISIGTLPAHPLWGERTQERTGHATSTLIRSGDRVVLVDPGLPEAAISARLSERAGLKPQAVTDVFLTSFRPDVRRGIAAFSDAQWWIHEPEREQVGVLLAQRLREVARSNDSGEDNIREVLRQDVAILQRCKPAPDKLAEQIDLFPLPGYTPGLCGLLIAGSRHTTVICGDAVATFEHLEQGMVLAGCVDVEQARESFKEVVEIADLLILGRDNLVVNPMRRNV